MNFDAKIVSPEKPGTAGTWSLKNPLWLTALLLIVVLGVIFRQSFQSNMVAFSNDGPLGTMVAEDNQIKKTVTGLWDDLHWLGSEFPTPPPNVSCVLRWITAASPRVYLNILYPVSLFIAGIGACFYFRRIKLAPVACILGGLAAGLNSDFLSTACWGVSTQIIGFGLCYLALGLLAGNGGKRSWVRVVLAGMAVGLAIMEAYDVGAIFSMFVGVYVMYQALFMTGGPLPANAGRGVLRLVLVAGFAGFISWCSLTSLIGTQITGVVGTKQDEATRKMNWDRATQWSLPKAEVMQILVPGFFGFRMDSPGTARYWGTIGSTPVITEAEKLLTSTNAQERTMAESILNDPNISWRFTGTGYYAGVFVMVVAFWAAVQSLRRDRSPFSLFQRRAIWFWSVVMIISLLLAFGRYASFYKLFYSLPYMSTIRNPAKFMHVFHWAMIIVFAYGLHGIWVAYMKNPVERPGGFVGWLKSLVGKAGTFERKWLVGSVIAVILAGLLGRYYAGSAGTVTKYMQAVRIDPHDARGLFDFSVETVIWAIVLLVLSVVLLAIVATGQFAGRRAKWAGMTLGLLMVLDLGIAAWPWINYLDVNYKYASNPIIDRLAEKRYDHRMDMWPFGIPEVPQLQNEWGLMQGVFAIEWHQHLFPYYNVQALRVVQEPRPLEDKEHFLGALPQDNVANILRMWQITNTRYLLGPGGMYIEAMQKSGDPVAKQFRVVQSFDLVPKPGTPGTTYTDYTAEPRTNGQMGVIELTNTLPRAKLYSNWQVVTNDASLLKMLPNPAFDPSQTVLVSDAITPPDAANAGKPAGTVEINPNYQSRRVELAADVKVPSVLLLCDRYNPRWTVTVDGQPAKLLRCNYITRGVSLSPGKHDIVFHFGEPLGDLYVSLAAIVLGLGLCGWLAVTKPDDEEPEPEPEVTPAVAPDVEKK